MKRLFIIPIYTATVVLSNLSLGQDDFDFWPNPNYDPSIPSIEAVSYTHLTLPTTPYV